MTQNLQNLVSKVVPAWVLSGMQSPRSLKAEQRIKPAPNTEAEAAAWLMRRERRKKAST